MSLACIDIFSHNIKIYKMEPAVKAAVVEFCKTLMKTSVVDHRGRRRVIVDAVYASSPVGRSEIRIHANLEEALFSFLASRRFARENFDVTIVPPNEGVDVTFDVKDHREPRDYQETLIDYMGSGGKTKVVTLGTGGGKAQPLDAKILTPTGWSTMGEMQVGTEVLSANGERTKVTNVFPQGKKDIYRITFCDGRSAECCLEHLWRVFTAKSGWVIRNTEEIKRRLDKNPHYRYYVQLPENIDFDEKKLPIDPYALGSLLGDGHIGKKAIHFSTADAESLDRVRAALPPTMKATPLKGVDYQLSRTSQKVPKNPWLVHLREMGLDGKLSDEKFIPEMYKWGSVEQRMELLRGLLDTDGFASKNGHVQYYTVSKQLCDDVVDLARGLGLHAKIHHKKPFYKHNGEKRAGKLCYIVALRSPKPEELFHLTRKRERMNNDNQYASTLKLAIRKVELVRRTEAQCISVEHPSRLYVTDGYTVTHNTFTALKAFAIAGKRVLITIPGRYVKKWIEDCEGAFHLKKGDLMVIRGGRDLKVALNQGLEGAITAKIIICTSTTIQNYIKDHTQRTNKGYPVPPELMCQTLGIGRRLTDECHQFFHLNFTMELYTHTAKTLNLSATLEHGDPFINRMIQVIYPYDCRMQGRAHKKYIDVSALSYYIEEPKKIPHIRRKMYSHTMFEESILKKKFLLDQYIGFIVKLTNMSFVKKRKEGQKMLIFAATKKMCGEIVAALRRTHHGLTIARYVSEDDYKVLHTNDIVVTTLGSAGTAVDVEDLKTTLMTVSIDSRQSNAQALGRLREMVNYDYETPEFLYIYTPDIDKQRSYHERKFEIFRPLCRNHNEYNSGFTLKTSLR